jgi:outer membrane protein
MNKPLLGLLLSITVPVQAETLADAVQAAYQTNPTLAAARARQDALGETVNQALALGRLTASADLGGGYDRFNYGKGGLGIGSATLPIWAGGRVKTAVRAAQGDTASGAESLRDTAAATLQAVVSAYAGLLYDQQAVAIAQADIQLLDNQVADSHLRFKLGNATRTDVARLEAQRAGAQATLAEAQATLASDAAGYRATVGQEPGTLDARPRGGAALPGTLDQARERALASNPVLLAARHAAEAAGARVEEARANGNPYLSAGAAYGRDVDLARGTERDFPAAANAGLTLHIPILTGGLVQSQVRQARANRTAAGFDTEAAAREAVRATDAAWAALIGARASAQANEASVTAAELALKGVRAEYSFGLRSTLDILVADESLRGAQLSLARAQADIMVAEAALLRATGRLDEDAYRAVG